MIHPPLDLAYSVEAKMLCKKIVLYFSYLSRTQENGLPKPVMTEELLSLVSGLAHYLKNLIRISLASVIELDRAYPSNAAIARFLNKLMELGDKEKRQDNLHGKGVPDAEGTLCLSCRVIIDTECFVLDHHLRWHPKCLICTSCSEPLSAEYRDALYDSGRGEILCQRCKTPEARTGFAHATKLEQYIFLLRVALVRLENLLLIIGMAAKIWTCKVMYTSTFC